MHAEDVMPAHPRKRGRRRARRGSARGRSDGGERKLAIEGRERYFARADYMNSPRGAGRRKRSGSFSWPLDAVIGSRAPGLRRGPFEQRWDMVPYGRAEFTKGRAAAIDPRLVQYDSPTPSFLAAILTLPYSLPECGIGEPWPFA